MLTSTRLTDTGAAIIPGAKLEHHRRRPLLPARRRRPLWRGHCPGSPSTHRKSSLWCAGGSHSHRGAVLQSPAGCGELRTLFKGRSHVHQHSAVKPPHGCETGNRVRKLAVQWSSPRKFLGWGGCWEASPSETNHHGHCAGMSSEGRVLETRP